jgi:hypothetical protein
VEFFYYSRFASKVVSFGSTKTLKLAVSQFQETSETSLFVSDSVKTSFGSFDTKRTSKDTYTCLRICVITVVSHPRLYVWFHRGSETSCFTIS